MYPDQGAGKSPSLTFFSFFLISWGKKEKRIKGSKKKDSETPGHKL